MCGLAGFWHPGSPLADDAHAIATRMADQLAYRGPDDAGAWIDRDAGIALSHRRLSILDLSETGHQPMASVSGRYIIVFNGEIYNHQEIRRELNALDYRGTAARARASSIADRKATSLVEMAGGPDVTGGPRAGGGNAYWRGSSDTETLLAGFQTWGIENTLKRAVGMFAFALWDREEQKLTLARDRIGEKPLYYGCQKGVLFFGSELKALKAHPAFSGEIDRDALCLYLRHCSIPAPFSIYKGIKKLLPGTYIQFAYSRDFNERWQLAEPKKYWDLAEVARNGMDRPFRGTDIDAIEILEQQLKQTIALQMIADVPLGAFLSGGVDSSTIAALMQVQSSRPIKTFSIGFSEADYNEAEHAKAVAVHLGTDHTEHYVSPSEAMQVIPKLGRVYDEPFADSSQIPTFLISQTARRHVTVSLSGDAGDELFCGYNRYQFADVWKRIAILPLSARKSAAWFLSMFPRSTWEAAFQFAKRFLSLPGNAAEKLEKLSSSLSSDRIEDVYYALVSTTANSDRIVLGGKEPASWLTEVGMKSEFQTLEFHMMFMDSMTYLPDDILVKVDRAAMYNSLETRVPFLDHRIVEFTWALPLSMKLRNGQTKWILRQVLYKYVPKALIERPKMGFGVPIGDWIRGPLREWADDLLNTVRLKEEGIFDAEIIRKRWNEHLSGRKNWQHFLWTILMFQEWLIEQKRMT